MKTGFTVLLFFTVVGNLDDCVSVSVQKEELAYAGTGYIVVMVFGAGYQLGVTETTNIGGSRLSVILCIILCLNYLYTIQ